MSDEDRRRTNIDASTPYSGESDVETYDDEEVPTVVLIIIAAIAVLTAALYMTVAGGHNHFH